MCGICGQINLEGKLLDREKIIRATRLLEHRGPDDEGFFFSGEAVLGMRRLSIIDLDTGKQPIFSQNNRFVVVYNGELYNYIELKEELVKKGHKFGTKTDTEVVLHLYEEYGVSCLEKMNGMFAFSIWDTLKKELFLARDRLGIKPLYYACDGKTFLFGSEMKAVKAMITWPVNINPSAIDEYLRFLSIPAPETIYSEIKKLLPGHYMIFDGNNLEVKQYWNVPEGKKQEARSKKQDKTEEEYVEDIYNLLNDSVAKRLMSDVSFGAFLSGGIDSAIIVALMSKNMSSAPKTFSIGFSEKTYNELEFASVIAKHFNTDHKEYIVKPSELISLMDMIIDHFDEPFADSSAIPTYIVSKLAANDVKMVLSGDGGDELFGGYDRYKAFSFSKKHSKLLSPLNTSVFRKIINVLPENTSVHGKTKRIKRFINGLKYKDLERYIYWMTHFNDDDRNKIYTDDFRKTVFSKERINSQVHDLNTIMRHDLIDYLPNDLLTKVDRMSMANSLEVRVPFLDHLLVEYAVNIPSSFKIRGKIQKYILRKAFKDILPLKILQRKKHGFGVPVGAWFKNELKNKIHSCMQDSILAEKNIFSKKRLLNLYNEHLQGKADHGQRLYALFVLESWIRKNA
ncbi:asparagine synthase (glutamine-hydrolyzing) [Chlamydiota bacterium]